MASAEIRILPLRGLPEIVVGDDLGGRIAEAVAAVALRIGDGDVFVVAQKIVSKAEGRVMRLDTVTPSPRARQWAAKHHKDARAVELILRESRRIVRMERGILITETHHGFICANAGVDSSNVPKGTVTLLPEDPDRSASRLQACLGKSFAARVAVIISDTFGRPWRLGLVNVALGVAGLAPLVDYRGQLDSYNRTLQVTVMAVADELASAAELVMGKADGVPVAVIQGFSFQPGQGSGRDILRPAAEDLFR